MSTATRWFTALAGAAVAGALTGCTAPEQPPVAATTDHPPQTAHPAATAPEVSPTPTAGDLHQLEVDGFVVEDLGETGEMLESLAHTDLPVARADRWRVTPEDTQATVAVERIVFDRDHPPPSDRQVLRSFGSAGQGPVTRQQVAGVSMFRFDDHNGNAALLWATKTAAVRFQATEGRDHGTVEVVAEAVVPALQP